MEHKIRSIRPFIGAMDFEKSLQFYRDLGFEETSLGPQLSVFKTGAFSFYLQNAYVKEWIENTMILVEVEDLEQHHQHLTALGLPSKYETVKVSAIQNDHWGSEYFVHDPSGILWHFGTFV